jgi:predicted HicB family RNase H-like nuclease
MREKPKKAGRPKMPKGQAKAVVLQSRVQPNEKVAYQKAAKAQGVDLSQWVRQTLNEAIKA